MPKQTFYHLSQEKKETLIHAAIKEFTRVPLHDASISNIIKEAGIPRGSFYQYFDDKEDLYFFILNEHAKQNRERFVSILKEKNGDLFETFIEMFQFILKKSQNQDKRNFIRNAYLNLNYKAEKTLAQNLNMEKRKNAFLEMSTLINMKILNIEDEQTLFHVMKILMAVTFQNVSQAFAKELPFDEALQNYTLQMELLKKGLYREES